VQPVLAATRFAGGPATLEPGEGVAPIGLHLMAASALAGAVNAAAQAAATRMGLRLLLSMASIAASFVCVLI